MQVDHSGEIAERGLFNKKLLNKLGRNQLKETSLPLRLTAYWTVNQTCLREAYSGTVSDRICKQKDISCTFRPYLSVLWSTLLTTPPNAFSDPSHVSFIEGGKADGPKPDIWLNFAGGCSEKSLHVKVRK